MTKGILTMNKKIRSLLIAAALTLPLLVTTTATAGPDCANPKFADHWSCSTTPPDTTTTTVPDAVQPCDTVTTLSGSGHLGLECDWTLAQSIATTGTVTVTVIEGEIFRVVAWVRDSSPGDICVLEQWDREAGTVFTASFPLIYGDGTTFWEHGGTHWCEPFDPVAGQRTDLNGEPLHVSVGFRASRDTVVEVSLSPGQAG
jgi:hypothetical protein